MVTGNKFGPNYRYHECMREYVLRFNKIIIYCLLILLLFINLLKFIFGTVKTINTYVFPNNEKESLSNIYFADNTSISVPIQLVYEREFILGIKCRVSIKVNSNNIEPYNLGEEYNK